MYINKHGFQTILLTCVTKEEVRSVKYQCEAYLTK